MVQKYNQFERTAKNLSGLLDQLMTTQNIVTCSFGKINDLEKKVDRLEADAYKLDAYVKRLETNLKSVSLA
jgi:hypothetical protein